MLTVTQRHDPEFRPKWENRRNMIWGTWLLHVVGIAYLIVAGEDTALHQNALYVLSANLVITMGWYIFGSAWDDSNLMKFLKK